MEQQISVLAAFLAGVLAFVSPCVLPIIPGYIAYISGVSAGAVATEPQKRDWRTVYAAIAFVIGFSIVFTAMGAAATFIGQLLQEYKYIIAKIAGVLVILLGVHFTGIFLSPRVKQWLYLFTAVAVILYGYGLITTKNYFNDFIWVLATALGLLVFYYSGLYKILYEVKTTEVKRKPPGIIGAFIVGVAFAFGWSPCIGPVLGAILLYASQQETVMQGVFLLFAFSMGLGIPFIITAAAIDQFFRFFNFIRRYFSLIEIVGGLLLILIGILLITGKLEEISGALL